MIKVNVPEGVDQVRLDQFLSTLEEPEISRSYASKLIKDDRIQLNGRSCKASSKVKEGDELLIDMPEPVSLDVVAEDIPLDIVYEDEDFLIVNKPKGMVVHPAAGHYQGTLVNAVMNHCGEELSTINGVMRPGIVHRIDKNTTGLLVVCKNDKSHKSLAEQLKEHSITRKYVAVVCGNIKEDSGTVDAPLGRSKKDRKKQAIDMVDGRNAVTHFRVLERFGDYTLVECVLETGRTHQIRVHMASIGHPVLGDDVYGPKRCPFTLEGQCLHAKVLGFIHPSTGEYVEFDSEYPEYLKQLMDRLRK
ncbi:23S rRNA pseudouridine1911/1915/1917 synthase [Oribacterium sp. KHPX15]|uniref:RluA family pseudouridine synthase n=1 Tax=Oribacterium sp. KHPX15 TaxID=1855342 RepID=UPI00089BF7CD|nr:RluA family pseudouridine synthase [Oribacterium sp. KHPX15]SDZ90375.1 23S rRNA pseudouridine1911/1915/1917 synthase [Oribacterium sp. KHPX15]